jgi:hypothetical protein
MMMNLDLSEQTKAKIQRSVEVKAIVSNLSALLLQTEDSHEKAYLSSALENAMSAHSKIKESVSSDVNKIIGEMI